ncbi:hypothetical protein B0H16DRAFT_1751763 [Mycena metata]|uniref:F-box domain-containing protein n=1 Tax=Mycena metata TaxID=1033252 RepID=A0AAD7DL92_9AGAR|nr:hypothetical protein B0H16DRAFT_1751763 [Mycena metata]
MDSIPPELKYKILRAAVGVFRDQPHLFMRTREIICCLSREWRILGLSDTAIWSHVFVSPRLQRVDIVRRAMRGPSEIDIYLELLDPVVEPSFLSWFADEIGPLLLRCCELRVVSPHRSASMDMFATLATLDGTSLEFVHLDVRPVDLSQQWWDTAVPPIFHGLLPHLRSFSLRRNFLLPSATPFLANIQELKLHSLHSLYTPTIGTMLDVLRATPSLVRLYMRDVELSDWRTVLPAPNLPHLTHLGVVGLSMGVIDLCSLITAPSLHTFLLEYGDEDPLDYMHIVWNDIFLTVTTAIIRTASWDPNEFGRIMSRFSSAVRFDLRRNDQMITVAFHHVVLTWHRCFPKAELVVLPTSLTPGVTAALLTDPNRTSASPNLHIVAPSSLHDRSTFEETYVLLGNVVSRPVIENVDYWN